jgi:hypothetical protein
VGNLEHLHTPWKESPQGVLLQTAATFCPWNETSHKIMNNARMTTFAK